MYEHYETEIVLNSNLMIPNFPHIIKIRLAILFFLLRPDFAKSGRNKLFFLIGPILFLYYEESQIKFDFKTTLVS